MSLPKRLWADVPANERMSARDFKQCNAAYNRMDEDGDYYGVTGCTYWWEMRVAKQAQGCAAAVPVYSWPNKWNRCAQPVQPGATFCQKHGGPGRPPAVPAPNSKRLWADVPPDERMNEADLRYFERNERRVAIHLHRQQHPASCQAAVSMYAYGWPGKWNRCAARPQPGAAFCVKHGGPGRPMDPSLPVSLQWVGLSETRINDIVTASRARLRWEHRDQPIEMGSTVSTGWPDIADPAIATHVWPRTTEAERILELKETPIFRIPSR